MYCYINSGNSDTIDDYKINFYKRIKGVFMVMYMRIKKEVNNVILLE